ALNQAIRLDPDLAEAHFKLGIAYALIEVRDRTGEIDGSSPEPKPTGKGKKSEKEMTKSEISFEKAVDAYKKILKANEEDHVAHFNLGRAQNKLNEDEEAAKSLKEAVKLYPDDTEYQTELGAIMIKLARYSEAIAPLKKALELDPENSRATELLSDAQAGKKRIDFTTVKKDERKPGQDTNSSASTPATNQIPAKPPTPDAMKPKPVTKPTNPGNI
ncbi:MAG: tetratricopeptide repeat protein, partial [Acidobacteria bacterium]|nr:tetratricopeptide repeat protein [Acidobacteriota bacterium]